MVKMDSANRQITVKKSHRTGCRPVYDRVGDDAAQPTLAEGKSLSMTQTAKESHKKVFPPSYDFIRGI